eukprot:6487825-Amphidinium_carterae.2
MPESSHPFIIAGDFNLEPHQVMQVHWADAIGANLIACGEPTCTSGRELDFFLLHSVLLAREPMARAYGLSCCKPHTCVLLVLKGTGPHDVVRVPRKKKAFAEHPQVGPPPFIAEPVWASAEVTNVNLAWKDWSLCAEKHLCALDGLLCVAAYLGRGDGLKVRHMPLHRLAQATVPQRTCLAAKAWRRIE